MREVFTNPNTGDKLAELDFHPVAGGAQVAKVDAGEITRHRIGGPVSITLFTGRGGFKTYKADSVEAAIIVYGLTVTHCKGLPGVIPADSWDMPGLFGTAGRD